MGHAADPGGLRPDATGRSAGAAGCCGYRWTRSRRRAERGETLVALDEALDRLAAVDERLSQVVECRYFGGLTAEETAEALGVSTRTVERDWVKARGWLRIELAADGVGSRWDRGAHPGALGGDRAALDRALDLAPERRAELPPAEPADDPALRSEVERLLRAAGRAGDLLTTGRRLRVAAGGLGGSPAAETPRGRPRRSGSAPI